MRRIYLAHNSALEKYQVERISFDPNFITAEQQFSLGTSLKASASVVCLGLRNNIPYNVMTLTIETLGAGLPVIPSIHYTTH